MAKSQQPERVSPRRHGPLADALVALAETPDHASGVEERLTAIAALAADRIAAADYASITTLQGHEYTAVATTSDVARAVDEAQFADRAGPCLQALETGEPVGVPDIAATMHWPGFHEVAPALGLRASVSVPLYTGRGTPIAVLNLYGRDDAAMQPLIAAVAELYATSRGLDLDAAGPPVSDPGAEELLTGYASALSIRATIRLAVDVLAGCTRSSTEDAYTDLCARAAEKGTSLSLAAAAVLRQWL
ncbi:GAF domain-containing protein [Couchioplanes azureus]|uniref:GAF domain-containing protein n=1 Tax=Couchioplanes caeruleus TaxID=56438 RepID=UPI001671843F|nr:GAF domain-containing protein [Couchioplanes caeruleus]GGQ71509.1 transcriptional regulator [Couchioplanes caeruleus subsp. azureus]